MISGVRAQIDFFTFSLTDILGSATLFYLPLERIIIVVIPYRVLSSLINFSPF